METKWKTQINKCKQMDKTMETQLQTNVKNGKTVLISDFCPEKYNMENKMNNNGKQLEKSWKQINNN